MGALLASETHSQTLPEKNYLRNPKRDDLGYQLSEITLNRYEWFQGKTRPFSGIWWGPFLDQTYSKYRFSREHCVSFQIMHRSRQRQPLIKNTIHSRAVSNNTTLLWYTISAKRSSKSDRKKGPFLVPEWSSFSSALMDLPLGVSSKKIA